MNLLVGSKKQIELKVKIASINLGWMVKKVEQLNIKILLFV